MKTNIFRIVLILLLLPQVNFAQNTQIENRLREHIEYISSDSLLGRAPGSPGEKAVAKYLYQDFKKSGLIMLNSKLGQEFTIAKNPGDTIHSENIVGIVEGYDSKLKNEYIVVGSHIDHVGTNTLTVNGKKVTQIFPGANKNASGIACLMEVAKRVREASFLFKRSVVFVGFGAETQNMAGAWYFVNRSFPEIKNVRLMTDINSVGIYDKSKQFFYFTSNTNKTVDNFISNIKDSTFFLSPEKGYGSVIPSDYVAFHNNEIPSVLFTTGVHQNDNTVRDTPDAIDYESLESICGFIYEFLLKTANSAEDLKNQENLQVKSDYSKEVYSAYTIDTPPSFFKGDELNFLHDWIYKYLKYPKDLVTKGIQGKVIVEFIIEADGVLSNASIIKSDDDAFDEAVLKVVNASPKWKPGMLNGKKVRVKYRLPVEFRLKKK
ncbi:MAG: TonB family protein [Bacteroidales bacterium]